MTIDIAIVGCGAIVRNSHLPALMGNPHFRITALVDRDLSALGRLKRQFRLTADLLTDFNQATRCDAVLIATPPHLHARIAMAALQAGKHVLCEKPIATTKSDAQAMLDTAREYRKTLLIGLQKFYCPNNALVADIIDDGFIGQLRSAELICAYKAQWDAANANRFNPDKVPGGVLFESGIHWLYRIMGWLGPLDISRYQDDRIDGVEANALIEASTKGTDPPIPVRMYFAWDHAVDNKLVLRGDKGFCEVRDGDRIYAYVTMKLNQTFKTMQIAEPSENVPKSLYDAQLDQFVHAIQSDVVIPEPTLLAQAVLNFTIDCYQQREPFPQPWVTSFASETN